MTQHSPSFSRGARVRRAALLLGLALIALAAQAHRMPGGEGVLRVQGREVFLQLALPLSALGLPDGLHERDLAQHRQALAAELAAAVQLEADGQPGELLFEQFELQQADGSHPQAGFAADHLLLQRRLRWPEPIRQPRLRLPDWSSTQAAAGQLSILALRDAEKELAVLGARHTEHLFFRGSWATAGAFLSIGVEHILLGFDHLLFLLTLLLGAQGWRRWLALISSFTVAHSLSLCLSATGWLTVSADWVEPLIAASIVLLAALNLRATLPVSSPAQLGPVFLCGLLHGLGFASALQELGLDNGQRWASLIGFNLGVELGQLAFVGAVLLGLRLLSRSPWQDLAPRLPPMLSGLAGLMGLGLLLSRLA